MSFTVEITAEDDGSYTVASEPEAQESAEGMPGMDQGAVQPAPAAPGMPPEEMGMEEAERAGQNVKTLKEALTLALNALKNGGTMDDVNGQDAEFNAGFGSPQGGAA
jgi:hypothetical protein